ncbi:DNA-directed RNA polymerase subunit beta [Perilla frutescens var. hirtella]|uniref:DNA-directed RNA polymerase subunit beta n=1 Tax=Perilla frutescens var. hirtella TaxID=608512 RepID=A0AAD4PBA2_PERFH|nr:DNA-directed RNA polymerase subunit beta [Perilla frutescens var. frutescens]KAH6801538.1 DNA-directed RNA polymerase subunit beta [Perilla frutescens var. hirtella]KAH6833633.1 DNA-directed RNA polymerase subunit beta [Perilla frutescens var. hirtella]
MPTTHNLLEGTVSTRRPPHAAEDGGGGGEAADDSKTRKHVSIATRVTNYLTRAGYVWPILITAVAIMIISSLVVRSRDLVPASSFDGISRLFFPLDGVESDFGALGVPWCRSKHGKTVEWTSKDLLRALEEFVPIYETRPIKNNMNGMGFDHSFGLWFITRWLKPDLMIESGAFKGHSTWVLRQAMPDTRILSLSPRHPEKYLKKGPAYVDGNCTYFAGKDFVDFGSMDWESVLRKHGIEDPSRALVFFDDHQNELKRLKQALKAGFKHLVFEDNYDTGIGDHYSLRQICDQFYIRGGGHSCFRDSDEARIRYRRKKFWEKAVDTDELCGPGEAWWGVRGYMRDDFNHSNKAITYDEHFQNSRFVESVLNVYWELPPVAGPSLTHQTRYEPARSPSPVIKDGRFGLFQRLGLSRLEPSVFNGYTQMVYVQVSELDT